MNQLRTADSGDNPYEQRDQSGHRNREESDGRIDRHIEVDWALRLGFGSKCLNRIDARGAARRVISGERGGGEHQAEAAGKRGDVE